MMMKPSVVPTERLIYQLNDYTCDGTINTFIDTGIRLFGIEYDAFRIELTYDNFDLSQNHQSTLLESKLFSSGASLFPGLTLRLIKSGNYYPGYNAINIDFNPLITPEGGLMFRDASYATVSIVYNKIIGSSITLNNQTTMFSGEIRHDEPLTIGGRYSSHLSNPDRFVQVHISSLKIYATPSGIDNTYIYTPLTFKCLTGGDLSIKNTNGSYDRNFEYSLNGGAWTAFDLPKNTASKLIATLSPNDTISFRRDNDNFADAQFISDSNLTFDIYGNLLSLQYGSAFDGQTELRNTSKKAFGAIFSGTNVVDASKLMLTASTLSNNCYNSMFENCTNLITAPELPATTLGNSCYTKMFSGCSNLVNVPNKLPATTLVGGCYSNMFAFCTSLLTAPELPAVTIASTSYQYMFRDCSQLSYVKCFATDGIIYNNVGGWLSSVSNIGTFVKASGATWNSGASGIPYGWTVIEE